MRAGAVPVATTITVAGTMWHGEKILPVVVALAGAGLARTVFVDRENKKLGRRQTFRETLPLTLVAMLIAGVVVYDQGYGLSQAAFTGLGVGWAAITLLDVIGRRIANPDAAPSEPVPPPPPGKRLSDPIFDQDDEIDAHLARLDRITKYSDLRASRKKDKDADDDTDPASDR